jgi:hypothetical protein
MRYYEKLRSGGGIHLPPSPCQLGLKGVKSKRSEILSMIIKSKLQIEFDKIVNITTMKQGGIAVKTKDKDTFNLLLQPWMNSEKPIFAHLPKYSANDKK